LIDGDTVEGAPDGAIAALRAGYWANMEKGGELGRDWRKCAYIAWACLPKLKRWPATEQGCAEILNLRNTSTIRRWKAKNPDIEKQIALLPKMLLGGHVADVLAALVMVATEPIPQAHQDRKLFLEMTGLYQPKGTVEHTGADGGDIKTNTTHSIDPTTAGDIFDILASVGAIQSGVSDAEADEVHFAPTDA
jgi:hypothetical protein